jgi:transposase
MVEEPKVRVREPRRSGQPVVWEIREDSLALDHPARLLWEILRTADLRPFTAGAKAVEGAKGRKRLSPHMLLTLWGYALLYGVGSARRIEALTGRDMAFRWIVADLEVSHKTLSDFLGARREALEALLTDVFATLLHQGWLPPRLFVPEGEPQAALRAPVALAACRELVAAHLGATLAQSEAPEPPQRIIKARAESDRAARQRVEEAISTVNSLRAQRRPAKGTREALAMIG